MCPPEANDALRALHDVLSVALEKGEVPMKIFSIVDSDAELGSSRPEHEFSWDVYHIENYLLETKFILNVARNIGVSSYATEEDIYITLRDCARETLPDLVRHRLAATVNAELVGAIVTKTAPRSPDVVPDLAQAVQRSAEKVATIARDRFDLSRLATLEKEYRADFETALGADTWRRRFRGRDVLSRFCGRINKVSYEVLRNLIVAEMRGAGFQPPGMKSVVDKIRAM